MPMDPIDTQPKKVLEEILALTQENNKILHGMRRSMRWSRIMSILYWVFIIGSAVGALYLIQPYLDSISGAYNGANSILDSFGN